MRTDGAGIGMGAGGALLRGADEELFLGLCCGDQGVSFSCFIKLHTCSYGILFHFVLKRLEHTHTHIHTEIGSCHCPIKTLLWPHSACKEKYKLFLSHGRQGLVAPGSLLKASTITSLLPTLNFQFLKSTVLSYVMVFERKLLPFKKFKCTLFPLHLADSCSSFRPQWESLPQCLNVGTLPSTHYTLYFPNHSISYLLSYLLVDIFCGSTIRQDVELNVSPIPTTMPRTE